MLKLLVIILALTGGNFASATGSNLGELEQRHARLVQHQQRLETQLHEITDRTARLKRQPSSVGRDMQLDRSLKESQELASRLTLLNRQRDQLETTLIGEYRTALSADPQSPNQVVWQQRIVELERRRQGAPDMVVATGQSNALDSAEDLDAKADLLLDSQERVARQLRQVESRLVQLEKREALLRHSSTAEDSLFVEGLSRRVGSARAPTALVTNAGGDRGGQNGPAPSRDEGSNFSGGPPRGPSAPSAGNDNGGESAGPPSNGDSNVSLREVLDPLIFETVKRSGGSASNLREQLTTLRQARSKLQSLSDDLQQKSQRLRDEAADRRKNP